MIERIDPQAMLEVALEEARLGLSEGGIPIGAALFSHGGAVLGRGHNRRVQENDPSVHGETDAFRKAGRQRRYQDIVGLREPAHDLHKSTSGRVERRHR